MSQSKRHSALETATNTAVGFVGSYFITFGCFHLNADLATKTLYATLGCTVWSLLRGYYLRRLFNHLHTKPVQEPEAKAPSQLFCRHIYVDGFGAMGDSVVCCRCGVDKYPEVAPGYWLAIASGRVIKENHPEHDFYADLARAAREKAQAQ